MITKGCDKSVKEIKISLAAARVNKGLTQDDIAKKMHVSKRTIVNWEKGIVIPSLATVEMLSRLYGIPINNIRMPIKST